MAGDDDKPLVHDCQGRSLDTVIGTFDWRNQWLTRIFAGMIMDCEYVNMPFLSQLDVAKYARILRS